MALQPPPSQFRNLLGNAYKWLIATLHSLNNTQTATNSSLFVAGLTIQNNTPSGGKITWSSCTLYYLGTAYQIAAGSTTHSELFVVWNVGQSVFTPVNSYTPGPTVFPIITNSQGFGDVTWDKLGANAVQASHLFPVITYDGPNGSLVISNVVFTDNSPGAGQISWTACQATYQGITYSIPSGTGPAINPYIVWQLSSPNAFQAIGALTTLQPDDFVLGINTETGNPAGPGFFSRAITLINHTGEHFIIYGTGFIHFNAEGNATFSAQRFAKDAVASPAYGQIVVADGQGLSNVGMQGNLGTIANPCGVLQLRPVTVAHLPAAGVTVFGGESAFVSDATSTTFASIVAGGGANPVPVYFDGTNWRIG